MLAATVLAARLIESIEDRSRVIAAETWCEVRMATEAMAPAVPRNLGFMPRMCGCVLIKECFRTTNLQLLFSPASCRRIGLYARLSRGDEIFGIELAAGLTRWRKVVQTSERWNCWW